MAYSNFTLEDLQTQFGIHNTVENLFDRDRIEKIKPNLLLSEHLKISKEVSLRTEKMRSELIIAPVILHLKQENKNFLTYYSGEVLNADKEKGLNGECDYLITQNVKTFSINTPIISVIEAKKGDEEDESSIGQCAAQMYGSKIFNEKHGKKIDIIYGCVTSAKNWKFLKLDNHKVTIDKDTYFITEIETILGIFQHIINYYKKILT